MKVLITGYCTSVFDLLMLIITMLFYLVHWINCEEIKSQCAHVVYFKLK